MLLFRRDIALGAQLEELGYDEYWVGEHHSSGWETIGSPELVLAAVGERTHTIRLGTGVISLPYHHPFNVASRLAQRKTLADTLVGVTGDFVSPWAVLKPTYLARLLL